MRNARKREKISRLIIIGLLVIAGINSCKPDNKFTDSKAERPRNIILMIGDGMGVAHVYAGLTANGGHLNLESCQYVGFQKTHSASSYITDSGASGTAMATGKKTFNGAIAVDTSGNSVKTILEMAEDEGLSTGLVATSTITHATPASFVAHNPDRGKYEEIAQDFIGAGIEVIIGGGRYHFNKREDGLDLLEQLKEDGYLVTDQIERVDQGHQGPIAVFTDSLSMPPALKGRGDLLPRATELAIESGHMESGEVAGIFGTDGHTGVMVPVFAYGPGAEKFAGIYENTDIFKKMASLLDLE